MEGYDSLPLSLSYAAYYPPCRGCGGLVLPPTSAQLWHTYITPHLDGPRCRRDTRLRRWAERSDVHKSGVKGDSRLDVLVVPATGLSTSYYTVRCIILPATVNHL